MKIIGLLIIFLAVMPYADVEVDQWVMPVKVFYTNETAETLWIEHNPSSFYYRFNQLMNIDKEPHPGKNILFMNKFDTNRIKASKKFYKLPDGYQCLIDEGSIDLSKVAMIEIITSDSLHPVGIWGTRFVSNLSGKSLLEKKVVFIDTIVTEEDAAYNAQHVYCFDKSFTKKQIRSLFSNGGIENPVLKKALQDGNVVFIEEVTP